MTDIIKLKGKPNGTLSVFLDGHEIDDLSFNQIKQKLAALSPVISQLENNNTQFNNVKNKIKTLKANIDNQKLSDSEFRAFAKTLF